MGRKTDVREISAAVRMVAECGGNRYEAARRLGITRDCIRRRLDNATMMGMLVAPPSQKSGSQASGADDAHYLPSLERIWQVEAPRIRATWDRFTERSRNQYARQRYAIPRPGRRYSELVEAGE